MYEILTQGGIVTYLVGVCFIEGCDDKDYIKIVNKTMKILDIPFESDERDHLTLFSMEKNNDEFRTKGFTLFLKLIPAFILFIHIFIIFSHKFLIYIYKKFVDVFCKKCKKKIK